MPCQYTGREPSPKGRGMCAHDRTPGKVETGRDGNQWVVAIDRNGRRFWQRVRLTRATNMQDAYLIVQTLYANRALRERLTRDYPDPDSVQFFPQTGKRLRWARQGSNNPKGYMIGHFAYAPELGVVFMGRGGAPHPFFKNIRSQEQMEAESYIHQGDSLLFSGPDADPVFEIL